LESFTSDILWVKHKRNICDTALKKLEFFKHVVGRYSDEKVKEISSVRPHLEYAASIRDPGHIYLIHRLNKIQRKVAQFVTKSLRANSVIQRIEGLGWGPTGTRRLHARLKLLKKFISDSFQSDTTDIILTPHYIFRSDNGEKITEIHRRKNGSVNSFFPRTMSDLNKR
jgi:hypothetical protein